MKTLLFLVGLIMVATACTSGESGSVKISDENNKACNQSFIFCGFDGEGRSAFDICSAAFDESSQTLILSLASGKSFSYKADEINPEYMDEVKNHKVSMLIGLGKETPVVVQKDAPQTFETIEFDTRQLTLNSILKNDQASGVIPYWKLYLGLYIQGYSKAGTKMLKEGCVFFSEEDFKPEITGQGFPGHGRYSAAFGRINSPEDVMLTDRYNEPYNFKICMARYENNELLIRIDDGKTYRYPIELFYTPNHKDVVTGKAYFSVSAVQTSSGNWIPVKLWGNGRNFYYNELIPSSDNYIKIMRKRLQMATYQKFMALYGVNAKLGFVLEDLFFDLKP